uniref:hypothetical protein n=1 Tax=Flavobacterium sp. TaxID=239 RepID=UPI0025F2BBCA
MSDQFSNEERSAFLMSLNDGREGGIIYLSNGTAFIIPDRFRTNNNIDLLAVLTSKEFQDFGGTIDGVEIIIHSHPDIDGDGYPGWPSHDGQMKPNDLSSAARLEKDFFHRQISWGVFMWLPRQGNNNAGVFFYNSNYHIYQDKTYPFFGNMNFQKFWKR